MELKFYFVAIIIVVILTASVCIYLVKRIAYTQIQLECLQKWMFRHVSPHVVQYSAPDGIELRKAHEGDLCYDLYTSEDYTVNLSRGAISTGIKIAFPKYIHARVLPRSGASTKGIPCTFLDPKGNPTEGKIYGSVIIGTLDSSYRGVVKIIFKTDMRIHDNIKGRFIIPKGTKLAQLEFIEETQVKLMKVSKIDTNTGRGENGFNSTGF